MSTFNVGDLVSLQSGGVPVYLVSEEYAGLPVEDRRDIMSAIIGLWEVSRRIDGYISAA